ncbi:MAG: phosphoribosylformylglycinamidine synthase subunit PurS [Desulfosarcina sp.]|nr:phosphoribosylformylglycinamidine synthase subunit PurS [Desulfobacterales bacterium]
MPHRLEITLKPELIDAEGETLRRKAMDYFGIAVESVRTVVVITIDIDLTPAQLETIRNEIFTNPVTQVSSYAPLPIAFDWMVWIGYRPGVRDNAGSTAVEAIEDLPGIKLGPEAGIYTSKRYCLVGPTLDAAAVEKIAGELLANDIVQQWKVMAAADWNPEKGIGIIIPKVRLDHVPTVTTLPIDSDAALREISDRRNLAINPNDIPTIRKYFLDPAVQRQRAAVGLSDPTDLELEYISQARSDHCNHNTFQGLFRYSEPCSGYRETIDNLFKTCIQDPTLALKERKDWVVSVLWDNAGVGRFDDDHYYVITGETHNSPSNMEAYGGAITGIVGVYRDPLGTGKGARLVMGGYGYCVGPRDYNGDLKPLLHPRRLLDGVIEGVRDGGNKSGIPTTFGQIVFNPKYLGKCLVFVTAVGLMPAVVDGEPAEKKKTSPDDLIIMCGGRVGKDGIHGVTASSEIFSENTPAGHVQIGDPYTQKKMHDFLLEARDDGLIRFVTDNGGGGLSSSIGESALFSNGCEVSLEKVPLKYAGLDQWEIWISESQERMTVAVRPDHLDRFMALSRKHSVESTVIGRYTDTGKLQVSYEGKNCASVDLDLLKSGFPQWVFDAVWQSPEERGLCEPVIGVPTDFSRLLPDMLARPNLCSREWVPRQYDHEVQGGSVIKPLVGVDRNIPSDAGVIRPVLTSSRGLAFAQSLLPTYSAIDAYHMTACAIDEALRRVIAVGGDLTHVGGVDNFCWPNIQYDPLKNPDGRFKAAQLVRACRALKDVCLAYEIPLLSGKDSMYVDGNLPGRYGVTHKVSAPETIQFSTISRVPDVSRCMSMEAKQAGDFVYLVGMTRNELGGSEYYEHLGYTGLNVPQVHPEDFLPVYRALQKAIAQSLTASVRVLYRGGLGIHAALVATGGRLGMSLELADVICDTPLRDDLVLFSESAGRFLVTVDPARQNEIEAVFKGLPLACIGKVTSIPQLIINGRDDHVLLNLDLDTLITAWEKPYGDLI